MHNNARNCGKSFRYCITHIFHVKSRKLLHLNEGNFWKQQIAGNCCNDTSLWKRRNFEELYFSKSIFFKLKGELHLMIGNLLQSFYFKSFEEKIDHVLGVNLSTAGLSPTGRFCRLQQCTLFMNSTYPFKTYLHVQHAWILLTDSTFLLSECGIGCLYNIT